MTITRKDSVVLHGDSPLTPRQQVDTDRSIDNMLHNWPHLLYGVFRGSGKLFNYELTVRHAGTAQVTGDPELKYQEPSRTCTCCHEQPDPPERTIDVPPDAGPYWPRTKPMTQEYINSKWSTSEEKAEWAKYLAAKAIDVLETRREQLARNKEAFPDREEPVALMRDTMLNILAYLIERE